MGLLLGVLMAVLLRLLMGRLLRCKYLRRASRACPASVKSHPRDLYMALTDFSLISCFERQRMFEMEQQYLQLMMMLVLLVTLPVCILMSFVVVLHYLINIGVYILLRL